MVERFIAPVLPQRDAFGKNRRPFKESGGSNSRKIDIKMFYTYILKSEVDGTHYYGHTSDLIERLKRHNLGKVRYTKGKRPWKIIYNEPFETKSEAYKKELFFKTIEGYRYLKERGII
jgi:putative endonuclease